jgi:maleate isomerase
VQSRRREAPSRRYFQGEGFEVVHSGPAALPSDQQAIQPNELYEWVRSQTPNGAEAVFIGGNGFRAIGTIEALEENLDRPILTANQVAFWQALALQLPTCFEMRTLSGGLVRSAPE